MAAGPGARHRGNTTATRDQELRNVAATDDDDKPIESDLTGEWGNIALLMLLYTLQGVPMGVSQVMQLILKEQKATFSDLATFSLNSYPFVLKVLWAPIVDTVYLSRVGRRKTWLVPAQLAIGVVLLFLSGQLDRLLYSGELQIAELTALFFLLYLLCATQDVAVDGWALTMLRPENRSYAATTNSVGQTLGATLGYAGFVALEQLKLTTMTGFLYSWGIFFLVATTLVAFLKKEEPVQKDEEPPDVFTCYMEFASIARLRSIASVTLVLLTWKAPFSIAESAPLKMQEAGLSKETLTWVMTGISPLYMLLPVIVAKWTAGSTPFSLALTAYPWRLLLVAAMLVLVYATPTMMATMPAAHLAAVVSLTIAGACLSQAQFVSQMAFFASISDPAIGGTYMTMLNTIGNLGGMWPNTLVMKCIDWASCLEADCTIPRDGFYILGVASLLVGVVWYFIGAPVADRLQKLHAHEWRVSR